MRSFSNRLLAPSLPDAPPRDSVTARQLAAEIDENAGAVATLRLVTPIGLFFLLVATVLEARANPATCSLLLPPCHWLALATLSLLFGLAWLPGFRPHWRLGVLLSGIAIVALMVRAAAAAHNPAAGYLTLILCPFAAAAFVVWGWRWQLLLNLSCLLIYAIAELAAPSGSRFALQTALGLLAALTLAQFTAVFSDRRRRLLNRRLDQLALAAELRETEIATMTHDLRNPLATLIGLMTLLLEDDVEEKTRANLLARMWSTTAAMDLLVKNLLDLYMLEQLHMHPNCRLVDADAVVNETAQRYAFEARLRGLDLAIELGGVPQAYLDPMHLERIVANLITDAMRRTMAGAVRIRTSQQDQWFLIEISDEGPPPDLHRLFERPTSGEDSARAAALGRYIARALVEVDGGTISARSGDGWGLTVIAQLPASPSP
jgi:signal transduction histidine kinase